MQRKLVLLFALASSIGACSSKNSNNGTGGSPGSGGAPGSGGGGAGDDSGISTDSATGGSEEGGGPDAADAAPVTILAPWDWAGVIGTGQSLAVGDPGSARNTAPATVKATTQPYNNLKLSTGNAAWPIDPNDPTLAMEPLVEPVGRLAPTYPSSWPTNIAGETPHSAMSNQITAMVMAAAGSDYVTVQGEYGENGQCLTYLRKGAVQNGVNGRAYAGTLIATTAMQRLAMAAGKTFGVGAVIVTHGECDAGNATYENDLYQLLSDYNTDVSAITGQTQRIQMIVSQQNSVNDRSASTLAQWHIGVSHPADVACSGPKYQYSYAPDGVHLLVDGYEQLGEKYGQVYFERVVLGRDWQPLQPTSVERSGRVITVHYHVPVLPMVWDSVLPAPNQTVPAWQAGKGFEVRAGATPVTISSVQIAGNDVQITTATDLPATGVVVGYAMTAANMTVARVVDSGGALLWTGTLRWGQLRDSDAFVGSVTKKAQPNYGVAFEMPVP